MIRDKHDLNEEERVAHERMWGGYNDFPPGWRKIKPSEFAQSLFFTFPPTLIEYRQMMNNAGTFAMTCTSAHLYFYHENCGYAIVNDFWGKKLQHYAFGCDQPHPNRHTCPKCGFAANYDTSD